jgi:hypothetical protein
LDHADLLQQLDQVAVMAFELGLVAAVAGFGAAFVHTRYYPWAER